jgi:hypothetical protein
MSMLPVVAIRPGWALVWRDGRRHFARGQCGAVWTVFVSAVPYRQGQVCYLASGGTLQFAHDLCQVSEGLT